MKALTRILAAAGMTLGLMSAPAFATDGETFVFRVDAATLQTQADVTAAYERLSAEAARYCRSLDLGPTDALEACRADVIVNIVTAVGDSRLEAAHRAATSEQRLASIQ